MKERNSLRKRETIGWRELVGLPELGISQIAAKIDTGARTSALHTEDRELFERNGEQWVRFKAPKVKNQPARLIETPIKVVRGIKNTSGIPENRFVIETVLQLGAHQWRIDVSLADRGAMTFDFIIGRRALKGRKILVDPARSYLSDLGQAPAVQPDEMQNPDPASTKRKNP